MDDNNIAFSLAERGAAGWWAEPCTLSVFEAACCTIGKNEGGGLN